MSCEALDKKEAAHTPTVDENGVLGNDGAAMGDRILVKGRPASESRIPNEDRTSGEDSITGMRDCKGRWYSTGA